VAVLVTASEIDPVPVHVAVIRLSVIGTEALDVILLGKLLHVDVVATSTMLGAEVSTTNVAVIVAWVFGSALAFPKHML